MIGFKCQGKNKKDAHRAQKSFEIPEIKKMVPNFNDTLMGDFLIDYSKNGVVL